MLFITVRSASSADVPKVLQVVEHVKRLRHKRGDFLPLHSFLCSLLIISAEVATGSLSEELHQYVIYDTQPSTRLQRIKLDDPPNAYTPPSSLTVHLSKIPMPELRPHPHGARPPSPPPIPPPKLSPTPRSFSASASASTSSLRQPPSPNPQVHQMRSSSAPLEMPMPTIPTQQQHQQQQPHATIGSLLWGRPRKSQH